MLLCYNTAYMKNKKKMINIKTISVAAHAIVVIVAAIGGVLFLNMAPENQNIESFCSHSSTPEWDCKSVLTTNLNIAQSHYVTDAVTCFGVATIAFLLILNIIQKREK